MGGDERNVVVGQCFGQNAQHRRLAMARGRGARRRIQGWIRRARVVEANAFYPDGRPATDLFDLHAAGIDIVEYLDARM